MRIRGLLLILLGGLGLGYWLAPEWFGIAEMIGIIALIGAAALPLQNEIQWLAQLREKLFWIGGGLTLISVLYAGAISPIYLLGWIMTIILWTGIGLASLELANLNRFILGGLFYALTILGIGLGYIGQGL